MNQTSETGTFRIRAYGRTELALLYNPHLSAGRAYLKLKEWIAHVPGLQGRLSANGYDGTCRTWTPAQVALIVDALGEP